MLKKFIRKIKDAITFPFRVSAMLREITEDIEYYGEDIYR